MIHIILFHRKYDKLAYEVLDACEKHIKENDTLNLLIRKSSNWGETTCLQLAEISGNKKFIAHSAVQARLDNIWCNGLKKTKSSDSGTR